jgi:hypothetical protein
MTTATEATPVETIRTVKFVGDYFALYISVPASDDDQAIENANAQLQDHYGWDVGEVSNEIEVEDTEVVW